MMVTIALGTTAPLASETTPEIVDVASWPLTELERNADIVMTKRNGILIGRHLPLRPVSAASPSPISFKENHTRDLNLLGMARTSAYRESHESWERIGTSAAKVQSEAKNLQSCQSFRSSALDVAAPELYHPNT